jgi:hypothetical protein
VEIKDRTSRLRGYPGEGLLYPQIVYRLSLNGGRPDTRYMNLEPPIEVAPGRHARFQLVLTEPGFAWTGYIRVCLGFGGLQELELPWIYIAA